MRKEEKRCRKDNGEAFIKRNAKMKWKKTPNSRIEMPDYVERSYHEALVNALAHRDYLVNGSEVHIDIYDDRMEIYSPGGMPDGSLIQERDPLTVPSTRRNPVLADVFNRLGYMERKGSGFGRIISSYEFQANYSEEKKPKFRSDRYQFTVVLPNLNYGVDEQNVEFMYGKDHVYYEDEYATGFMKYYVDCKYGFVALIPNEGVSVADYVKTLNGESLNNMLNNPVHTTVYTSIPKFETEYDVQMGGKLAKMGMPDAFDEYNADFSKLGTSEGRNIYIGSVTHKTFISVGEKGTKAGAATVVEMSDTQAEPPTDIKEVNLDRPFVYMIVDCENNIPLFIGTMMNVNN